ncbi:MAG: hypothetical protein DMF10_01250 [Verrucomicrobia bacterium]|nr:MAG: hypothetical protein DMF11_02915 [Verrucomicrobiota bacterium]PYI49521.1 MAG: hypothetical protein DMF10_01250 [Verrucomicrobiota bacterium]
MRVKFRCLTGMAIGRHGGSVHPYQRCPLVV